MAPEDLLSMMRKDIYFVSPGPGYFVVRFLYPDSATAQRVVAEIVAEFQKANLVVTQSASRQNDPVFPNKTDLSIVGLIVGTALGSIAGLALYLNRRRRRTAQTGTPQ